MGNEQSQFMCMFERLNEPLCFGPRGSQNAYFNIDSAALDASTRKTAEMVRRQLAQGAIVSKQSFKVRMPEQVPDLSKIGKACKRSDIFSYFLPGHNRAANALTSILMAEPSRADFFDMCAYTRDHPMVNSQLWVHAVSSAALRRKDMRGFRVPAIWEIQPEMFISTQTREWAQSLASIPEIMRKILKAFGGFDRAEKVTINEDFSATRKNPENELWYFREDLGIASHHWHWHLVYATEAPVEGQGSRDRKGELFYYMHRNILQRYEAERISNGLPPTVPLDLSEAPVLEEGYFPKLTSTNSARTWPGRQDNTKMLGIFRNEADTPNVTPEEMRVWKNRLLTAIETGYVIGMDGTPVLLTLEKGIDILGSLVENGGASSLNREYYGDIHNLGHSVIAFSHDPDNKHNEGVGVMGNTVTAHKDPAFYRLHKFFDNMFDVYKQTLPPYTENELVWPGIRITEVSVSQGNQAKNILVTSWMESDIDLARGLDIRRSSAMNQGPVWARVKHLNHEPFKYNITVESSADEAVDATLRIFMAPRNDIHNERLSFSQQRILFFEMDKASIRLNPGLNQITRTSTESSVTVPWEQSFRDLEAMIETEQMTDRGNSCGCGWPQHLLLPKGSKDGVTFDVFVMLTDGAKDAVHKTGTGRPKCKPSVSYCGILDELYPDAKPMGYPLDRVGRPGSLVESTEFGTARRTVKDLEEFIPIDSNMVAVQVQIFHEDSVALRGNGAPSNMPVWDLSQL